MFRRCKHEWTRCIHGDEGWARMKVYTLRWWKESVVHRQACLDCGAALDRGPICSTHPGQHVLLFARWVRLVTATARYPRLLPGAPTRCSAAGCRAEIVWASTAARESGPGGKAMPLDLVENFEGNVAAAPRPQHLDGFQRAVAAELVRLTLGGRPSRPELVTWPPRREVRR